MRMPVAFMRHWRAVRAVSWIGAHLALGLRAGFLPCALAPHLGLILAKDQREELRNLRAGRAFQRAWLAAAAETLALQAQTAAPNAVTARKPLDRYLD